MFALTRAERSYGIFVLAIGCITMTAPYWLPSFLPEPEPIAYATDVYAEEVTVWLAAVEARKDSVAAARAARRAAFDRRFERGSPREYEERKRRQPKRERRGSYTPAIDYTVPLPAFETLDPNNVDSTTLFRLGVPRFIALRWLKFRERGGTFVRRADIAKLYDLEDSTFQRISDYFLDGEGLQPGFEEPRPRGVRETVVVEVNSATAEELKRVRGIGDYYANAIIKYRDRLGGFTSVAQIAETPRLRDSSFRAVRASLQVDPVAVDILDVNRWDTKRLARHPYLTYAQARTLVDYRRNHGAYASASDLYETVVLDSATVRRLLPYMEFAE